MASSWSLPACILAERPVKNHRDFFDIMDHFGRILGGAVGHKVGIWIIRVLTLISQTCQEVVFQDHSNQSATIKQCGAGAKAMTVVDARYLWSDIRLGCSGLTNIGLHRRLSDSKELREVGWNQ